MVRVPENFELALPLSNAWLQSLFTDVEPVVSAQGAFQFASSKIMF